MIALTKRLAVLDRNDLCEDNSFNGYYLYYFFNLLLPPLLV
jgi:hypothetical protein